ncbi:hypothetical protein [Tardiphaga sp. 42S5]|uniref:hypothetical protein n=1 Tax=Tardiphaga sp. 42S5 TaxID=1404799 RepID=UPI002A5AC6F8|nr:hypothetical protein [Tardiphaga sp. 42S5]WPO42527.1 hypothetical protein SFY93_05050 [Tardiphaga sp. 42S5]
MIMEFTSGAARKLRDELDQMPADTLAAYEANVNLRLSEAITSAEQRAPGYLATRLLEQIEECPMIACGIPAYMVGGKDPIGLGPYSGGNFAERLEHVIWPEARRRFQKWLPRYFAGTAAGTARPFIDGRRPVRIFTIVQSKWLLLRIKDQAANARSAS